MNRKTGKAQIGQQKKRIKEQRFTIIPFQKIQERKQANLKTSLEQRVSDLLDAMGELVEVEQMTGRKGLMEKVYFAYTRILLDVMYLAKSNQTPTPWKKTRGGTSARP